MKKSGFAICGLIFVLIVAVSSTAQSDTSSLTPLGDKIADYIRTKKREWRYESITPMRESPNVLIQQWTSEHRSVKIALVEHTSVADAVKLLLDLRRDRQLGEIMNGLGDEAFTWGNTTVSFRRRELTIDVSAVILPPNLKVEAFTINRSDGRVLSKEFARLVSEALNEAGPQR